MTTLGADLAASVEATTMVVNAPDADAAELYAVDSETVRVIASDGTAWEIRRGIGSAIAAHSSGATLTPIYPRPAPGGGGGVTVTDGTTSVAASTIQMPSGTVSDAGGGTAAVGLILAQQVGPVHIAWDDDDITVDILVAALPAGSIVWDVAVIPTVDWDGGEGQTQIIAQVRLNSTPPGGGSNMFVCDLFNCQSVNNRVLVSGPKTVRLDEGTLNGGEPGLIIEGGSYDPGGLYVKVFTDGAGLTAGEADVYAVIAAAS